MLQQVFQLIQKVLSKWLSDAQVVEVSPALSAPGLILAKRIVSSLLPAVVWREQGGKAATLTGTGVFWEDTLLPPTTSVTKCLVKG